MLGAEPRLWQDFVGWGTVAGRLRPGGGGREACRPPEGLQTPAPASAAAGSAVPCGSGGDGGLVGGGGDGGAALRRGRGHTQPDSGIRGVRRGREWKYSGPGARGTRLGGLLASPGDRSRASHRLPPLGGKGLGSVREERRLRELFPEDGGREASHPAPCTCPAGHCFTPRQ